MSGWKRRVFSRRSFFRFCGTGAAGVAYTRFAEEEWLEVNQPELILRPDGQEIRILHLSDFHASPVVSLEYISRALDLGLSLKPDLICLTGDFVTSRYEKFDQYAAILKKAGQAAPAFACMGNHDGGRWALQRGRGYSNWQNVATMLKTAGVELLFNSRRVIELRGQPLQVVGVGDLWADELYPERAFAGAQRDARTILLSHNPDSKDINGQFAWDLMLCGHTHGGQLRLPLIGTPFAPVVDKRYVDGLKPWRDRWIHVTKGVGNLHGLRFNCRPEISLLRVRV